MKDALILLILVIMTGAFLVCDIKTLTYITLFSIFFPIHIPFMGQDAITTGTVCILILFLKYLRDSFAGRDFIKERYDYWIYLLILFAAFSIIIPLFYGQLEKDLIGRAARLFFLYSGSMLIFVVIKNLWSNRDLLSRDEESELIDKLLNLFLILISVHILISLSIKFFPSLGSAFSIFYSRTSEGIDFSRGGMDKIERIKSFVLTPESYGELLATISPVIIYKIFKSKSSIWFICLLLFCGGELLAVTRSGIILFTIGITFSVFYYLKDEFGKAFLFLYSFSAVFLLTLFLFPSIFGDTFARFMQAADAYQSGRAFIDVINRRGFIPSAEVTLSNLSLFGNGLAPFHFHNLLMTTLYEKGIIGVVIFFSVLLYPLMRLVKSFRYEIDPSKKGLYFICILSMVLFLINETKYEFIRASSYQQICMALLAVYYLATSSSFFYKNNKSI